MQTISPVICGVCSFFTYIQSNRASCAKESRRELRKKKLPALAYIKTKTFHENFFKFFSYIKEIMHLEITTIYNI